MFTNWFSEKPGSSAPKNDGIDNSDKKTSVLSSSAAAIPPISNPPDPQHTTLPSHISPHDAVIARIDNELQGLKVAAAVNTSEDPNSSTRPGETSPAKLKSRILPENMYDPFDGQSIGLMVPGEFEEEENDLWSHLAQIRDLQSDIARLHAQMERLGDSGRFGIEQAAEEETINVEDEGKAAKAAEFAKLSEQFNERKDAIDTVMAKVPSSFHIKYRP